MSPRRSGGPHARTPLRRLVGVSPKWVLMRYPLQEAALQLEQHPSADLTDIALGLGWYDQSHLSEDFRRVLGTTPRRYAERDRTSSAHNSSAHTATSP